MDSMMRSVATPPAFSGMESFRNIVEGVTQRARLVESFLAPPCAYTELARSAQKMQAVHDSILGSGRGTLPHDFVSTANVVARLTDTLALADAVRAAVSMSSSAESLRSLLDSHNAMRPFIDSLSTALDTQRHLFGQHEALKQFLDHYSPSTVAIQADGSVLAMGRALSLAEVQGAATAVLEDAGLDVLARNPLRFLHALLASIARLTGQPLRQTVTQLVMTLVVTILFSSNPCPPDRVHALKGRQATHLANEFVRSLREGGLSAVELKRFGLVIHYDLRVHQCPRRSSRQLDALTVGDIVEVLYRGRHWTRVLYRAGPDSAVREGWVLSRYVCRLHCERSLPE
jgi:hypothetical protein